MTDNVVVFVCQRKSWTKEEIRVLKRLFGTNTNAVLSDILERTPKAIERKANSMGLLKSKKHLRSIRGSFK